MASIGPGLGDVRDAVAYRISPGDTVRLAPLYQPGGALEASVFLEIWDPGGGQPPNSHEASVETFLFLTGKGVAHCDGATLWVRAGQFLVLPPTSVHRIVNTGRGKLAAITTMSPDRGFYDLVRAGSPGRLDPDELELLGVI
ncbi:MAG: cupin domain-containing protein [Acidimicrobiales bacterium]|nr:cupin domain-containing protein [Acidimicrobiales bacterium]